MLGTASTTRAWLLVEEPGPWGPGGVPTSRLGEEVTASLVATAKTLGARLLLVRRPRSMASRARPVDAERTIFRVRCTRGQERVLIRRCAPDDVTAGAASDDGWTEHADPLLLVCTHGRKDWCCALRGRPLAQALAAEDAAMTWECSHLGGCRFAANALALPTGHAAGRVDAGDAAELVAAVRGRRVVPRLLRGRCTDAMVVQAADAHARLVLGLDGVDDLVPVRGDRRDDTGEHWTITLERRAGTGASGGAPGRVVVDVRLGHAPHAQLLTCGAKQEQYARTWQLERLREEPGVRA